MKRKDFFKGTAAVLGSLAMARSLKPAELGRWIQTAAGDDEARDDDDCDRNGAGERSP